MRHSSFPIRSLVVAIAFFVTAATFAADRGSGTFTVDGETDALDFVKVFEYGDQVVVVLGDRPLEDLSIDSMIEERVSQIHVVVDKESGEPARDVPVSLGHEAFSNGVTFTSDSVTIESEKTGTRGFAGSVVGAESTIEDHRVAFEGTFEIELPDRCRAATVTFSKGETPAARAFADLYRSFTSCDFGGVADRLVAEHAEPFRSDTEDEEMAEMLVISLVAGLPREIDVAEDSGSDDEISLSVRAGDLESMEVVMTRDEGSWKLASGWIF